MSNLKAVICFANSTVHGGKVITVSIALNGHKSVCRSSLILSLLEVGKS
ncbi:MULTISPECIES: hypothetical protein [unclassified Gilliamella]|jgi:hypothetical protein|nr:hypothetical protein [Gilliamella apicola]KFA59879.1 hypothetical protein GAPWKB11_0622 [Gilliamella apicola]